MKILWGHVIDGSYVVGFDEDLDEDVFCWHEKRFEIHECKFCHEIHLYREVWDENCSGPRIKNGHFVIDQHGDPVEDYFPHSTEIVYPVKALKLPPAHSLMPDHVKELYEEARQVFPISRRSSAALLRLVIQELCIVLGGDGKNLNNDIEKLLDQIPDYIQQALDIIRVVGNSAVHPGDVNINDDNDIVEIMFDLVNEIVDAKIAKPKKKSEIYKQYEKLPDSKKRKFKTS